MCDPLGAVNRAAAGAVDSFNSALDGYERPEGAVFQDDAGLWRDKDMNVLHPQRRPTVVPWRRNTNTGEGEFVVPSILDVLNVVPTPVKVLRGGGTVLGTFGGRLAATADHAKLAEAESMAAAGATRDEVWNRTGWFQGSDGKWRFEIDDSAATFPGGHGSASEVVNHEPLRQAYPGIMDGTSVQGVSKTEMGSDALGRAYPDLGFLYYRQDMPEDEALSATLHEIQHFIQRQEGFSPGANGSSGRLKPGTDEYDKYAGTIDEYLEANPHVKPGTPLFTAVDDMLQKGIASDAYWLAPGELEARNVQTRMRMTPEQRVAQPPWQTVDKRESKLDMFRKQMIKR
jgi:hypothetical protein